MPSGTDHHWRFNRPRLYLIRLISKKISLICGGGTFYVFDSIQLSWPYQSAANLPLTPARRYELASGFLIEKLQVELTTSGTAREMYLGFADLLALRGVYLGRNALTVFFPSSRILCLLVLFNPFLG